MLTQALASGILLSMSTLLEMIKPGSPGFRYGHVAPLIGSKVVVAGKTAVPVGSLVEVVDINLQSFVITATFEGKSHYFAARDLKPQSKTLYLIEFYTNEPNRAGGFKEDSAWEINFAWVYAKDKAAAKFLLRQKQGPRFCEVITCEEQATISPLAGNFRVNTPDANLFIYR